MRESLPLSSLYKGLISASVEYVNPSGGPPALSLCPRDPHYPTLPSQVGERESGILQQRLGGPGLHPLDDYLWWREEGEGEVQDIILLTIPVPYGERTGLSSGTVSGVAGTACLSSRGTFSLRPTISRSHAGSLKRQGFFLLVCHRDGSLMLSDHSLITRVRVCLLLIWFLAILLIIG